MEHSPVIHRVCAFFSKSHRLLFLFCLVSAAKQRELIRLTLTWPVLPLARGADVRDTSTVRTVMGKVVNREKKARPLQE
jgi:hypothetical protein